MLSHEVTAQNTLKSATDGEFVVVAVVFFPKLSDNVSDHLMVIRA